MKKFVTVVLLTIISTGLSSQELSKVYVLSEGGFSPGTSMISMLDMNSNTFAQNIFNPGNIGLFPDGLIYHAHHLYLLEQGNFGSGGRIYKLDTLGSVLMSAVVGTNPYSLAIANDKIYITNGPASSVSVLNKNDLTFIREISVGVYPQEIIASGNNVFVANASLFGGAADSTVTVINSLTDDVAATIIVKKDPSSLALTNDGHLLVGCPGDATTGIIYKINMTSLAKTDSFMIPGYGFGSHLSPDESGTKIYFKGSMNQIIEMDLTTKSITIAVSDPAIMFVYGYRYDYTNRRHYLLDARDFMTNGALKIYDGNGLPLDQYGTGIAPRRVVFKQTEEITRLDDETYSGTFILEQNFPNPFNPTTNIGFTLPGSGSAVLEVFNSLGEKVAEPLNRYLNAGYHRVSFEGKNLSAGIYFYRIKASYGSRTKEVMITRKMTLIK